MPKKSLITKNNFTPVSWGSLPKNKNGTVQKKALAELIISLLDKYSAGLCVSKVVAKRLPRWLPRRRRNLLNQKHNLTITSPYESRFG